MSVSPLRLLVELDVTPAEPGVLEIDGDEVVEMSLVGAAEGDAVHMPERLDDVHPVVGEVDADGDAWPELLEGVCLLKKTGNHDNGWSSFDRLAVSCPNPEHVRCSRSSVALRMDVPLWECLVAGSMVGGNGAQGIHARHWKYANARSRGWTLLTQSCLFFFTVTSSGVWETVRLKASPSA